MTEPELFVTARELIRAGEYRTAIDQLMAGLAFYFNEEWAEALGMFTIAASGSDVPEDGFSIAMCQVKLGDTTGGLETWQKVFDLSYAHPGAPETGTFFQKKLLFAQALHDADACHPVGLDLLEHQLMGFFTNSHSTDPHTWGIRGVPQFDEVMKTTRDYYRQMGKSGGVDGRR